MKTEFGFKVILLLFAAHLYGCGTSQNFEDYSLTQQSDLILTPQNHPHGFGRTQCFECHNVNNIHQINRLNLPIFQYAAPMVAQLGIVCCAGCHDHNGNQ